jgi:hypothetical protein
LPSSLSVQENQKQEKQISVKRNPPEKIHLFFFSFPPEENLDRQGKEA